MSSINPNNIDGTYPIAGQDNDSQGFRDNFTNIKNNFTFAYDELTDLQSKAVLKSALNGSTLDNTMTYTSLNTSGNLLATGLTVFGNTTLGRAGVVSGQFHTVVGNITQTSSGGAVYINTTGNISTAILTAGQISTTGNVLATGLTVFGNLITGGAKADQGLQVYKPTANVAITANVNVSRVLLAPTNTIVGIFGAIVTLPNTTVNGTTIDISSNVATTLQPVAPWLSSINPSANVTLTAGSSARYFYYSTDNTWFKV
jgi:hypothetical protein